ncbi:MAG: ribonuclease III [Clostridiales Family XIII bacterium]|jgi:ribonuclease-3|nr:ribonuclease III [Clostridiales Family XIII bacterium]
MSDLKELQKEIGYHFKNVSLLQNALMHLSYVNEQRLDRAMSNQRLEFLGDAVLQLCMGSLLFDLRSEADEGELSHLRSKLVCTSGLERVARSIRLSEYLLLGKGAEKTREWDNPTVLEDAMEAVIGAVYLDGGWKKAYKVVEKLFRVSVLNLLEKSEEAHDYWDKKTALQIAIQKQGSAKILYRLIREEGVQHRKLFYVDVCLDGKRIGSGHGHSKKEAEQNAAGDALEMMNVSKTN